MTTSWVAGLANPIRRKAARKGEGALVPVLKGLPLPAAWNFKFPSPLMLSKALGLSFDCRSGRALRELGHALLGNGRGGYLPITHVLARSEEHTSELQSRQYLVC